MVTPTLTPSGFTGSVVNTGGSVNFTSGQNSGVYFLNCCSNSGNAYYQFTGSQIGSVFNIGGGQVSFILTSRQSWAQRQSAAGSQARYTFDVRDSNGNHLFSFFVNAYAYARGSVVFFNYAAAGAGQYFAIPSGYEDQLFGLNSSVKVRMTWDGSNLNLYLTNLQTSPTIYAAETLIQSTRYTASTPNWTSASNFDIGAYQYASSGYNSFDDAISMFVVSAPASASDTQPPTAPTNLAASAVSSSQINLSWTASTDNVGVTGYQIFRGGTRIGTTANTSYSDSGLSPSTSYTYTVTAYDAAGNVSTPSVPASTTTFAPPPPDTTPPSVSITAPANGAPLSGTVTATANATDNVAVANVQFQLDGVNLGAPVTGSGPVYNLSWNTTTASNASHTLTAVATDTSGNTASSSISVTVNNPPVISAVAAGSISSSGATITWTTNTASSSQVAYGTTASYGSTSPLNNILVTSHSVVLSALAASTTYHFQALSQDAQGNLASSADFTFTTSAPGLQSVFEINGSSSEAASTTNGSVVTPTLTPSGFTGSVVNTGGSVNFTSGQNSGVYFLNCCSNSSNAYYQFTGSQIGSVFNIGGGQLSFILTSRQSWAQRQSAAGSQARYTFDVRDGNGNHLFDFSVHSYAYASGSVLFFSYAAAGAGQYFAIPSGYEDQLFGLNSSVKVRLTWDGSHLNLYLTNLQTNPTIYAAETLVQSNPYTPVTPNWSSSSNFDIGAYQYSSSGYDSSDDVISMFAVSAPPSASHTH